MEVFQPHKREKTGTVHLFVFTMGHPSTVRAVPPQLRTWKTMQLLWIAPLSPRLDKIDHKRPKWKPFRDTLNTLLQVRRQKCL